MPEYFVRLDAFPLTASGKILKRELVEMAKRGELAPAPVRLPSQRKEMPDGRRAYHAATSAPC